MWNGIEDVDGRDDEVWNGMALVDGSAFGVDCDCACACVAAYGIALVEGSENPFVVGGGIGAGGGGRCGEIGAGGAGNVAVGRGAGAVGAGCGADG